MTVPRQSPKSSPAFFVNGEPLVGFDLGTTFSKAAYVDKNFMPQLVPVGGPTARGDDRFQMPSVGLLRSDRLLVGDQLPDVFDDDDIPIRLPKRFLADPRPRYPEDKPRFSAAEVCAQILKRLKARTEHYLNAEVKRVVLTIPPSFGSRQRQALLQAAAWADLQVLDLVEEPVAASVYDWMVERSVRPGDQRAPLGVKYASIRAGTASMLVFDLGGGTLDISLLRADGMNVDVLETWAGGEFLGGADFTQSIAEWIAAEIRGRTGFDPVFHLAARDKINQAAESIKRELTDKSATSRHWKQRGFKLEIDRKTYTQVVEPLLTRSETAIYQAAQSAEKLLNEPVKHLLVVGAGSRAHGVREMIDKLDARRVGGKEFPNDGSFWVALGAATMAWLAHQNPTGLDSAERSRANHRVFQLRRKSGLNLGISAWDSDKNDYAMRVILKANSTLPAEKTVTFGKVKSHQPTIRLKVVESPTNLLSDAKSVGEFVVETDKGQEDLSELNFQTETPHDKDPDREGQVRITLAYDITGRVKVSVLDRRTAKKVSRLLEPEPFDVDVSEAEQAKSALAKEPATATTEDEVKRMKRQLQELKAELERVSQVPAKPVPAASQAAPAMASPQARPAVAVALAAQSDIVSSKVAKPVAASQIAQPAARSPVAKPEEHLDIDLDIFENDTNKPIQTLFDDDSVVLDALSGSHKPLDDVRPAPKQPVPNAPASKQAQKTVEYEVEEDQDMVDDGDSLEDLEHSGSVAIDLGVNLKMNDARLIGLQYAMKLILIELVKSSKVSWDQFSELCAKNYTQPKAVFERINKWSEQKYQSFILTRDKEDLVVHREMLD